MKALALCLFLMSFRALPQDTELDSIHKFCPCVDNNNLRRALKNKWLVGGRGSIYQIRCKGSSFFFLLPNRCRISESIFLNGNLAFDASDKIVTVGPLWFYVKVSDRENMKYDFETHMWSRDKIPDGALGEEHF